MSEQRCLYCYDTLPIEALDYHSKCSKKFFGTSSLPIMEYTNEQMLSLAEEVIQSQSVVTGVQPKLSLGLQSLGEADKPKKLTIVGAMGGEYILKPPTVHYPYLPELESLTMHLAKIAKIETVPHALIRLASGELAYITKRIDRKKVQKIHMEDMCQITEKLTEHKYRGSYEQIGKALLKYAENPGLDAVILFEQVLFSFLTGNNDMHLKNFSIFSDPKKGDRLAPAYDMVPSELVVEGDDEELALNLNGKKNKIKRHDFEIAGDRMQIPKTTIENIFKSFIKAFPKWHQFIDISFIPEEYKDKYHEMIIRKSKQIGLFE